MAENDSAAVEASFLQFISGMAGQALIHLGLMSNPLTGTTAADLPNAKYSIDLLAVLQEKTRGNLTDEESQYLSSALADLRMRYVDVVEARNNAGGDGASDENDAAETDNDTSDA